MHFLFFSCFVVLSATFVRLVKTPWNECANYQDENYLTNKMEKCYLFGVCLLFYACRKKTWIVKPAFKYTAKDYSMLNTLWHIKQSVRRLSLWLAERRRTEKKNDIFAHKQIHLKGKMQRIAFSYINNFVLTVLFQVLCKYVNGWERKKLPKKSNVNHTMNEWRIETMTQLKRSCDSSTGAHFKIQ